MKETDLFEPVKNCLMRDLGCSDVYGEIQNCDVVGKRGNYDVIVEMKTSLNFKVILQAIERKHYGAYVYIAVPKLSDKRPNDHHSIYHEFIKPHGIGLIYVSDYPCKKETYYKWNENGIPYCKLEARVYYKAKFNHHYLANRLGGFKQISTTVKDWEKNNVGGSKGGEIITAYSFMIEKVKEYLKENGWSTIDNILDNVEEVNRHYASPKASLKATLKEKWNKNWIMVRQEEKTGIIEYNTRLNVDSC